MMNAFVAVTDYDWYRRLSASPHIDEVNFWRPGGKAGFQALSPGEPFLFKLKAPRNFIVGGAFFAHFTRLPCSLAWDAFGEKNGARTFPEFREKIQELKRVPPSLEDYVIGCILLEEPFFFEESDWIPAPPEFKPNTVQGRTFDLTQSSGRRLWDEVALRLAMPRYSRQSSLTAVAAPALRYGEPIAVTPRLGQGSFRVMVTDAYGRRCTASGERTLPVLEAAHIRPYSLEGEHRVDNGLLLRSDLHTLYDRGYLTVTPDFRIEVSRRIKEEFENGREYYALQGKRIALPESEEDRPSVGALEWHASSVFRS
jgi:putative restriction endonuclease